MKGIDRIKIRGFLEALNTLAPDLEMKFVERAVFDKKEWFAILIRDKKEEKKNGSGSSD